jgi:hypothetical protein
MRTKKTLKSAFVVTVATGAALVAGAGCQNQIIGGDEAPITGCPETLPAHRGGCDAPGQCTYVDECGFPLVASCDGEGFWSIEAQISCNPPPPDPPPDPPPATCPTTQPTPGTACYDSTLYCTYGEGEFGCPGPEAVCLPDGTWEVYETSCNPPPPECPLDLPAAGEVCEAQVGTWGEYPWGCQFAVTTGCGDTTASAGCEPDSQGIMVWAIDLVDPCTSAPENCGSYGDASLCDADPGCRYLVPGCAEGMGAPPAVAGCYPADDCSVSGCGSWGTCESVVNDPCAGLPCDACGELVNVCLPSNAGG